MNNPVSTQKYQTTEDFTQVKKKSQLSLLILDAFGRYRYIRKYGRAMETLVFLYVTQRYVKFYLNR